MNIISENCIVWLYPDKKDSYEIWQITDVARPAEDRLTFDAKYSPTDPSTYTIKGQIVDSCDYSAQIFKDGNEIGPLSAGLFQNERGLTLVGLWYEDGCKLDFIAKITPKLLEHRI